MVKARIIVFGDGRSFVLCQRSKYKHWFRLGSHAKTDNSFRDALKNGSVVWTGMEINGEIKLR